MVFLPACTSMPWREPPVPKVMNSDGDNLIIRAGHIENDVPQPMAEEMAAAEELFRQEKFAEARTAFRAIAKNTKNPPLVAEKARYFEAESLRQQGYYPDACDTYHRMLQDFPSGVYREQAVVRMFNIANFWLDDTRAEMDAKDGKGETKNWWALPTVFNNDRTKPTFDLEGRALKTLEIVHYSDITGPCADKALWLTGYVHFYRGDFREADHYLSQLIEHHRDSKLRPQAIELAIMAKNNSTGGSWYDGRKCDEARKLIHQAQTNCPELATNRGEFLDRQLYAINYQQAEKTYNIAEFYRRTHHPGSAYFYYDLVRRQFPGTDYANQATMKMTQLRSQLIEAQARGEPGLDSPGFVENTRNAWNRLWGDPEKVILPVSVPPEVIDGNNAANRPLREQELMSKPIPADFLPK